MLSKIISEVGLDVNPKVAYSFLIRFLELWGSEELL